MEREIIFISSGLEVGVGIISHDRFIRALTLKKLCISHENIYLQSLPRLVSSE